MIPEDVRLLVTSDGIRLRAGLRRPRDARRGAVLCHPHPDYGGSMHNTMIGALSQALAASGVASLRFDFRRPGTVAERCLDARAAIESLACPDVLLVGWSYGADVALAVGGDDPRVAGVVAVAPPLMSVTSEEIERLAKSSVAVLALVPEHDQFSSPARARERLGGIDVDVIEGADHYCTGCELALAERVVSFEGGLL